MVEPKPLPDDAREMLSQVYVSFQCPRGHEVETSYTDWDLRLLREQSRFGENYLDLTCTTCQTPFRVTL